MTYKKIIIFPLFLSVFRALTALASPRNCLKLVAFKLFFHTCLSFQIFHPKSLPYSQTPNSKSISSNLGIRFIVFHQRDTEQSCAEQQSPRLVHFGDPVRSGFRLVKGGHLLKTEGIKKNRNKNFRKCSLHMTWFLNKKKLRKLPPNEVKSSLQEL